MKKLMMALALACTAACFAQDAGTSEKKSTPQEKRAMRPHREHRGAMGRGSMMRPMRSRVKSFGKLANGQEAKVYRLQGMGGLILDIFRQAGQRPGG